MFERDKRHTAEQLVRAASDNVIPRYRITPDIKRAAIRNGSDFIGPQIRNQAIS